MSESADTTEEGPTMDQTPDTPVEVIGEPGPANESSKLLAVFGYLFVPVAIVALFIEPYKSERFVRFHAWQALGLWVVGAVLGLVPPVGLLLFVYAIYLAVRTWNGESVKVPLLYDVLKGQIGD